MMIPPPEVKCPPSRQGIRAVHEGCDKKKSALPKRKKKLICSILCLRFEKVRFFGSFFINLLKTVFRDILERFFSIFNVKP